MSRLKEVVSMFLALHDAGLCITLENPESIQKRLLAQDNIGIVPVYSTLHRAHQSFSRVFDVHDTMHYDSLGRYKRRITTFIRWDSLSLLKPCETYLS